MWILMNLTVVLISGKKHVYVYVCDKSFFTLGCESGTCGKIPLRFLHICLPERVCDSLSGVLTKHLTTMTFI